MSSETRILFEQPVNATGKGLLWAFHRLHFKKATGVFTIEWERYKKQIAFRAGEPVAIKSNWSGEAFGNFLVKRKLLDSTKLVTEIRDKEATSSRTPLGEWLVQRGLLPGSEMAGLLEAHFRERLFNLLALSHGKIKFTQMEDFSTSEYENVRLSEKFEKILWEAVRTFFTEAVSKQKLAPYLARTAVVSGSFPLPLSPQELRMWNALQGKETSVSNLDVHSLRLLAAASEFDQVSWGESPAMKLQRELEILQTKFEKAPPHEILGVAPDASLDDCKKAFHELVKKHHPDRLPPDTTPELRKICESVFARINGAFSTMSDPEKRREFEAQMELEKAGGMDQIQERLQAEMLLSQAKAALKRRHFKSALEMYAQISKVLVNDAEVLADKAFAELMTLVESKVEIKPKLTTLKAELETALKIRQNYAPVYYYRGMIAKLEGQPNTALADFESALELDPRLAEASSEARLLKMRKDKKK